ncbi:DUF6875 domain-containing protein [Streptosporangium sp. NPDC000396]|uniref:DUF6875 domain-containing protein n=1 Tax=Streptosporangium sp. NPDC000396 TaxID=3366185 RepID=UPI00369A4E3B
MLIHPADPERYLLAVPDLDALPAELARYGGALRTVADWAGNYLARPHPELGRTGPVCPFVPAALRHETFYLAVQPGLRPDRAQVETAMAFYRDWFAELEPRNGPRAQFKTILVLFPDVATSDAPEVIDVTQARLKASFVAGGLMIGQFHPLPPAEGGLWNPDFRPLRSPVPLLAIRHLVPTDLPFLVGERRFLESYARRFGDALPERQRSELARALSG